MSAKTVLITGGTGMIGTALASRLAVNDNNVIILSRDPQKAKAKQQTNERINFAHWDVKAQTVDAVAISAADIIVHLAGAAVVAKPWTTAYKKEILDSRTHSSAFIIKALQEIPNKVQTVISASAIGWYGADNDKLKPFTETDPQANNFLGEVCGKWEASIQPVQDLGKRLAIFRFGIVLSNKGGALKEFMKPLQFRIAGVLGNGKQVVSWIHIDDLCQMIQYALEHDEIKGVYNAVSPQPVTNKQLTITLAKAMHGKAFITLPVPEFMLKLMMGERSIEVLKSTTASGAKIEAAGFEFQFAEIKEALEDLVK